MKFIITIRLVSWFLYHTWSKLSLVHQVELSLTWWSWMVSVFETHVDLFSPLVNWTFSNMGFLIFSSIVEKLSCSFWYQFTILVLLFIVFCYFYFLLKQKKDKLIPNFRLSESWELKDGENPQKLCWEKSSPIMRHWF